MNVPGNGVPTIIGLAPNTETYWFTSALTSGSSALDPMPSSAMWL